MNLYSIRYLKDFKQGYTQPESLHVQCYTYKEAELIAKYLGVYDTRIHDIKVVYIKNLNEGEDHAF